MTNWLIITLSIYCDHPSHQFSFDACQFLRNCAGEGALMPRLFLKRKLEAVGASCVFAAHWEIGVRAGLAMVRLGLGNAWAGNVGVEVDQF